MTARQMFEALLVEQSKANAPSMLLQDFNYFFNKAINLYINKRYNLYDTSLQTTDDLRVLKSTAILRPTHINDTSYADINDTTNAKDTSWIDLLTGGNSKRVATYEVNLPSDYLHLLNCICIYKLKLRHKCYDAGDIVRFPARRLTSDTWSMAVSDYYNRPLPQRPYYFIHNINTHNTLPTNPITTDENGNYVSGTDITSRVPPIDVDTPDTISKNRVFNDMINAYIGLEVTPASAATPPDPKKANVVDREAGVRYGNTSNVRLEIRYGQDNTVFELVGVAIDYIKVPQYIRLTQELVNLTLDTSQILEFPDYVCQEIINELVHLVLENTADPRILTHPTVTQSIASPAQQLATPQARG